MDCRQIEALLPPYVDGEADRAAIHAVDSHLASCPSCRARLAAERTAHLVVRARAAHLKTAAPRGLQTRITALVANNRRAEHRLGWPGRLSAFAAAAALVLLALTGLEFVNFRSNVLLAAQLAIDHVRCSIVERHSTVPADAVRLQRRLAQDYGWQISVPPSNDAVGLTLVAARRCPFWLGPHAHLLYRIAGREVSLYVTPNDQRAEANLRVLGHVEKVWSGTRNSYLAVADTLPAADVERVMAYLADQTE